MVVLGGGGLFLMSEVPLYEFVPGVIDKAKREAVAREYLSFYRNVPRFATVCDEEVKRVGATVSQVGLLERILLALFRNFDSKELEDGYKISHVAELTEETRMNTSKSVH